MSGERVRVRFLFADSGTFHHEELEVPSSSVRVHDRLIDGLREDPEFLKGTHLDLGRLCAAWVVEDRD